MQAKEKLIAINGKEPTIEEIAKEIEADRAEVVMALESITDPVSLFEPLYSDTGDTLYLMDQISDPNTDESWMHEMSIKDAIASLSDREKSILNKRFLQGHTQIEVATEIGISQAQVSRLEKGAITKIKEQI